MKLRVLLAVVGTTALMSAILTVPLAVFAARREHDLAVRAMSLEAHEIAIELTEAGPFDPDDVRAPGQEPNVEVGVYRPDGTLLAGEGPRDADAVTRRAVFLPTNDRIRGAVVVVQPVVQNGERVAVIRLAEISPATGKRILRALLALAAFDVVAVAFAALVGWFVAARLTRPVRALRDDAIRLGDGDFTVAPRHSGISEIDDTADALAETATRLGETLRREREFTANASHQLRTPIASLRLLLESEVERDPTRAGSSDLATAALADVDRLQSTLDTMLGVARGNPPSRQPLDVEAWAGELERRTSALRPEGRAVSVGCICDEPMSVSRPVLDQIVDILVSNAIRHGEGAVDVSVGCSSGRLVVTVADEGRVERDSAQLFRRHDPDAAGTGVGLALARSLAEGEGGRVVLQSSDPTTFRLWLPGRPPADHP